MLLLSDRHTHRNANYPIEPHKTVFVVVHLGSSDTPMICVCLHDCVFVCKLFCTDVHVHAEYCKHVFMCGQGAGRPRGSEPQLQTQ